MWVRGERERGKSAGIKDFFIWTSSYFSCLFLYLSCFSASAAVVALLLDHFGDMGVVGLLQSLVCGVRYRSR